MLCVVLGNISIFWEYRDISLDNISYRGYSWISKYRISIFIVFIIFTYVKDEVYGLDMYVMVVTQAQVCCLICTHRAQGHAAPKGGHVGQHTGSCVATNMLYFHGLTVFIQILVTFDYGF